MSNELIIKAADAVETLRGALELWCTRDDHNGSPLGVRGAADDASAAAHAAITELAAIRNQVEREAASYDQARRQHTDALLAEVRPPAVPTALRTSVEPLPVDANPETADYKCGDCGQVFPVDLADPIESHGAYLDHLAEHDADDTEADR